ncbi:MAG: hypothetical protein HYU66_27855 [Armatimonadetes bacterium]|nr:hypothetical protein [Armatimonadota bacterium]
MSEVVEHGLSGLIVEGDEPDDYLSCLAALAERPGLREELATAGQRLVSVRYEVREVARRHALAYHSLPGVTGCAAAPGLDARGRST